MFARDVTIGRLPVAIFVVTIGLCCAVCVTFAVVFLRSPPTIVVGGAKSAAMVSPVAYSLAYHDAIGRTFITSYANWNVDNFDLRIGNALAMVDPDLASRLHAEATAYKASATSFEPTLATRILGSAVRSEDVEHGITVIDYQVEETDWMGRFRKIGGSTPAIYSIEVHWVGPESGSAFCSRIVNIAIKRGKLS